MPATNRQTCCYSVPTLSVDMLGNCTGRRLTYQEHFFWLVTALHAWLAAPPDILDT
jgi:hypothetical protein